MIATSSASAAASVFWRSATATTSRAPIGFTATVSRAASLRWSFLAHRDDGGLWWLGKNSASTTTIFSTLGVSLVSYGWASFPFFYFLTFLRGFVASPFRDVGAGFDEPNLRLMF